MAEKKIKIHYGFHPETERVYNGEHIYKVINTRTLENGVEAQSGLPVVGSEFIQVENNVWIRKVGPEKYVTDWTDLERWGRVEEQEYDEAGSRVSVRELGYIIIAVDRSKGLL